MAGDDRLETLARERGPALVGYAYLLTRDLHSAQDLVQESMVRTFSRTHRGQDVVSLEAYVRRAILNAYLNTHRSRGRWALVRHLAVDSRRPEAPETVATDRVDVLAALSRLSPRERACIVLRHVEDLTVPEIAARLSVSEGAVKRYLSDARTRLAPLLATDDAALEDVVTTREAKR
ncbi:RNA polymerase sigma factor [Cellulomonas sp. KRMCY2]|uniref:RNA polymerase sigma factor n=1 Tax=Cellulomonas sp. KRMCY2 TaxID=1304865 RepID=UPI00045E5A1F|nr:sigma-70 family RNA polymerase sigma factor [Cellulomonas sp. KRMCY2]